MSSASRSRWAGAGTLSTAVANARAIRVYEKVGFRPVGVTRKSNLNELSGEWEDELLMEYVV